MNLKVTISYRATLIAVLVVLALFSQTQSLSDYPLIDAPLSDRVFVLLLLGLIGVLADTGLRWLVSKTKLNKQQQEQTLTLERILTTQPPEDFHQRFMASYKLCRGRWELLIPIIEPVKIRSTVVAPERSTGFHHSVLEEMLTLARTWDRKQGAPEAYGFQVYWEHNIIGINAGKEWVHNAWRDGWRNTPLRHADIMLGAAQGVLVQDLELTFPEKNENACRRVYSYRDFYGHREIATLPGPALAYAEQQPQYIADTDDLDALYQTMGGRSEYNKELIGHFIKQHPGVRSMIVLPIPGNRRKQDRHNSMGVILLTSEAPNFIGEEQFNAFANYMLPFIWFISYDPPTQSEILRKAGQETNEN